MIYNKRIIFGVLAVIIILGLVVTSILFNRQPDPAPLSEMPKDATFDLASSPPLRIENFSSYPDVETSTKTAVTDSLIYYVEGIPHTAELTGVIRDGSYKKTVDGSEVDIAFLVDIANLKRSYKISFISDSSTGRRTLYTLCPLDSELIYPAFNCKDDLSEE